MTSDRLELSKPSYYCNRVLVGNAVDERIGRHKKNRIMTSDRLELTKPSHYCNGVLVGNWVEERIGRYKKNRFKHVSIYNQDYTPKHAYAKSDEDDFRDYGDNIAAPRITDEGPNYYDNFTTTYDLAFQHFPKWYKGTINRKIRFKLMKYEPTDEYLNEFGNLSSRNDLTHDKQEEWDCDILDPRRPVVSIAKNDYTQYKNEAYKINRWPRLHPVKVKTGIATDTVYLGLPPGHPRTMEGRVNPITWEGPDDWKIQKNCHCC